MANNRIPGYDPRRTYKKVGVLEKTLTKVKSHTRKVKGKKIHVKSYYRKK